MDLRSTYLEISMDQRDEAFAQGYQKRHFFPHRVFFLPKCGPDGFKQAKAMVGKSDLNSCWEIVLYAISPVIDEFPQTLFFDSEILYHQQQFGQRGQIATVNLFIDNDRLYTMNHQSDLVQRISRRRHLKTRVETVFKGWNLMLWNAILNFALERGLKQIYSPTAEYAMLNTDKKRTVQREMFDRLYNRDVHRLFNPVKQGNWWRVDVNEYRHRNIQASRKKVEQSSEKIICICHDIERGMGHVDVDPAFAVRANHTAPLHLAHMLEIEKELEVRASYCVVASFMNEVKEPILDGGHCLAFHSYDHKVGSRPKGPFQKMVRWCWEEPHTRQLARCREVDRRLKGYRPPRSNMTSELNAPYLCQQNIEWLASSVSSLGARTPFLKNRMVYIPIQFDDFPLYKHGTTYEDWERSALKRIETSDFVSFGLHDCYGEFWLPHYPKFLEKVKELGQVKTLNEVASEVILANSECP